MSIFALVQTARAENTRSAWIAVVNACIREENEIRETINRCKSMTTGENRRLLMAGDWKREASNNIRAINIAAYKARKAA